MNSVKGGSTNNQQGQADTKDFNLRERDKAVDPELVRDERIMTLNVVYRGWAILGAVRSTIRWFTYQFGTRISHRLSQLATVFIEWHAEGSSATGCISYYGSLQDTYIAL